MPNYDVECSSCGLHTTEAVKLDALALWDQTAECPNCRASGGQFRRIMSNVPTSQGGPKARARSEDSRKQTVKKSFVSSGGKDAMLHKNSKTENADQKAEAREIVKKGAFEGF